MPYCLYAGKTALQLQALAASGDAVAVLPIGAVEQHGPHLPVGTDFLVAQDLAAMAMEKLNSEKQFFLLPAITYALSIEHIHVPGTITLMPETLIHVLTDIGDSLLRLGVKKLVLVNCHGGNDSAIQIAGRLLRGKGMKLYMVNGGAIRDRLGAQEYDVHADEIETGMILAAHPEMVDREKITEELSTSVDKWHEAAECRGDLISCWYIEDISVQGVVGKPILATAEGGKDFMDKQSQQIAKALELAALL